MIFIIFIILVVFVGSVAFVITMLGKSTKEASKDTEKEVEDGNRNMPQ